MMDPSKVQAAAKAFHALEDAVNGASSRTPANGHDPGQPAAVSLCCI